MAQQDLRSIALSTQSKPKAWLCRLNLPQLPLPVMLSAPNSTSKKSISTPAPRTRKVVEDEAYGLKELWYCSSIWERVEAYVIYHIRHTSSLHPPPIHCSEAPHVPDYPPPLFNEAYRRILLLEVAQSIHGDIALKNNDDAQDAINNHLLDPTNLALMLRYTNTASEIPDYDEGEPSSESKQYQNAAGQVIPAEQVTDLAFYPQWAQTNRHNLRIRGGPGLSDRTLLRSPAALNPHDPKKTQVATNEGKTFWNYTTKDLEDILDGHPYILQEDDNFNPDADVRHSGNALLFQIYGQAMAQGTDVGFVTNCDKVMIYYRIGPRPSFLGADICDTDLPESKVRFDMPETRNSTRLSSKTTETKQFKSGSCGLVLSPLLEWNDPRLLRCIIGLSYLTLDEEAWSEEGKSIRDVLCPQEGCIRIRMRKAEHILAAHAQPHVVFNGYHDGEQ